jgi:probable rRNA maturation factor
VSLAVSVSTDGIRVPLARARVAEIVRATLRAERVREAMVSITFVTSAAIAKLNRRYLGHSGATDVISFAFGDPLVGDIYISPDMARRNAREYRVGVREELTRLVIHGVLHVTGHDHPEPEESRAASPMWKRQERLVRRAVLSA